MAGDKLTVMADERDAGYVHDKMKNLCYTSFQVSIDFKQLM